MLSLKMQSLIEKLENEFKQIEIKKKHKLPTLTPSLGLLYKRKKRNKKKQINSFNTHISCYQ
tara:strand:+ start:529 stop:714 length:186 start_codon:yes stop_codon:yes gene_type:complete